MDHHAVVLTNCTVTVHSVSWPCYFENKAILVHWTCEGWKYIRMKASSCANASFEVNAGTGLQEVQETGMVMTFMTLFYDKRIRL